MFSRVANLDVVNSKTIENYYTNNPVFEIAKGNLKPDADIGIVMHREGGDVEMRFSEKEKHLNVNKDLSVDGIVKAKIFKGDAGFLSNVQFNFEVGDTFENLNITRELRADGGLLSNISIRQLKDLENATLNLSAIYCDGPIHANKAIVSKTKIVAPIFYASGVELEGIALKNDLCSNVIRIENLEKVMPNIEILENDVLEIKPQIKTIEPLYERLKVVEGFTEQVKPLSTRIDTLEKNTSRISENIQRIDAINTTITQLKPTIPDVSQLTKDVVNVKQQLPRLDIIENDVKIISTLTPKFKIFETNLGKVQNSLSEIPVLNEKINMIERTCAKASEVQSLQISFGEMSKTFPARIANYERELRSSIENFKRESKRFEPLEKLISNVYTAETRVLDVETKLPILDTRIKVLEDYKAPIATLQSVTTQESNTTCTVTFENPNVSFSTVGNVGIGTTQASSKLTIFEIPDIVSPLGEVKILKINELAEINAYTKANAGLSSGRPGGLVFKTKRPNGYIQPSMTIDGNGSVTIGTSDTSPSAVLTLNSSSRGLLLPRLTTEQIQNIRNPEPGLMVYDIEKDTFVGYKKTGWSEFC